ncbi:MAG TPA: type II secretion system protein [Candidatus Dormibacteraeota bacterium]
MPRPPAWWPRDRRQAQSGATLVELLVSMVIMGLALVLLVGAFSTGLIQATLAKRNTAAVAVVQYELEQISGGVYNSSSVSYSDCFATEDATSPPTPAASFQGVCVDSSYVLRADVAVAAGPSPNSQLWSITVVSLPGAGQVGNTIQVIKVSR